MKKALFVAMSATALLFASCSKKSTNEVKPQDTNKVTIDGTDYATVTIGTQTWTAVNYNGSGGTNYNGTANNPTYGKFYTLAEAKAITLPSGWRLPTKADAETLMLFLGATKDEDGYVEGEADVSTKLKSKSDWTLTQGTNTSGFNAYPAGQSNDGTTYDAKGTLATFWTSTALTSDANSQYVFGTFNDKDGGMTFDYIGTDYTPHASKSRFSLRFVRDK